MLAEIWAMKIIIYVALALIAAYGAACGYMFMAQRSLLYKPERGDMAPDRYEFVAAKRLTIRSGDGTALTAWYAAPPTEKPLIYYLHGNAGNISGRAERFADFYKNGYGIFALSYRGYGDSEGQPTESGLFEDAKAGWRYLTETAHISPKDIIIYGESLGTGVASYLATDGGARPRFLALEAPYLSIAEMGKRSYPWLPVDLLLRDRFDNQKRVRELAVPLIVMHGDKDEVVPFSDGKTLYETAAAPIKAFYPMPGETHVDAKASKLIGFLEAFDKKAAAEQ